MFQHYRTADITTNFFLRESQAAFDQMMAQSVAEAFSWPASGEADGGGSSDSDDRGTGRLYYLDSSSDDDDGEAEEEKDS